MVQAQPVTQVRSGPQGVRYLLGLRRKRGERLMQRNAWCQHVENWRACATKLITLSILQYRPFITVKGLTQTYRPKWQPRIATNSNCCKLTWAQQKQSVRKSTRGMLHRPTPINAYRRPCLFSDLRFTFWFQPTHMMIETSVPQVGQGTQKYKVNLKVNSYPKTQRSKGRCALGK